MRDTPQPGGTSPMSGLSFHLRESPNVAQAAVLLGVVDAVAHDEAGFHPQPHVEEVASARVLEAATLPASVAGPRRSIGSRSSPCHGVPPSSSSPCSSPAVRPGVRRPQAVRFSSAPRHRSWADRCAWWPCRTARWTAPSRSSPLTAGSWRQRANAAADRPTGGISRRRRGPPVRTAPAS